MEDTNTSISDAIGEEVQRRIALFLENYEEEAPNRTTESENGEKVSESVVLSFN
jgi:hypothetical protein